MQGRRPGDRLSRLGPRSRCVRGASPLHPAGRAREPGPVRCFLRVTLRAGRPVGRLRRRLRGWSFGSAGRRRGCHRDARDGRRSWGGRSGGRAGRRTVHVLRLTPGTMARPGRALGGVRRSGRVCGRIWGPCDRRVRNPGRLTCPVLLLVQRSFRRELPCQRLGDALQRSRVHHAMRIRRSRRRRVRERTGYVRQRVRDLGRSPTHWRGVHSTGDHGGTHLVVDAGSSHLRGEPVTACGWMRQRSGLHARARRSDGAGTLRLLARQSLLPCGPVLRSARLLRLCDRRSRVLAVYLRGHNGSCMCGHGAGGMWRDWHGPFAVDVLRQPGESRERDADLARRCDGRLVQSFGWQADRRGHADIADHRVLCALVSRVRDFRKRITDPGHYFVI